MDVIRPNRLFLLITFGIYCFIYPSSLFLLMTDGVPAGTEWMASLMLLLQGLSATAWVIINCGFRRGVLAAVSMLVGAFTVEAIGVSTGFPFGQYQYTDTLSPKLLVVPVGIMFAWLMMMLAAFFTARFLVERLLPRQGILTIAALSAGLAVLSDLLMEPVAVHIQGYWIWLDSGSYYGVPWSNFVAWLLISLGLVFLLARITTNPVASNSKPSRFSYGFVPLALYNMNLIMFTAINLTHQNFLAGSIGLIAGGLSAFFTWRAYWSGRSRLAFLANYAGNRTASASSLGED